MTGNVRRAPTTLAHIYHEPVFHNPLIPELVGSPPWPALITPPNWYRRYNADDLRTIGDLCHQYRPGFHTPQELEELTGYPAIAHFVNRVTRSLPAPWYRAIMMDDPPSSPSNDIHLTLREAAHVLHPVSIASLTSRRFYLLTPRHTVVTIQTEKDLDDKVFFTTWEREFGLINWAKVFALMYRNHVDKAVTDVQFKHIHGKITAV